MSQTTCLLQFETRADEIRTSLSAIRQIESHLWLGCDETATLERLTYRGDHADDHHHFAIADYLDLPSSSDEEIDIEGIAYSDYYLWFVGSHSLKRKSYKPEKTPADNLKRLRKVERQANRYTLGRIPLVNGQLYPFCSHPKDPDITLTAAQLKRHKTGNELTKELEQDRYLGDFLKANIPGKDNGFDIDGLALNGNRLLLGLRGPVLRGWSVLLELQLTEDKPGILKLQKIGKQKQPYIRHFLNLNGLGIRDLCPWNETLLVLAGPTMTLDGPLQIFSIPFAALKSDAPLYHPSLVLELPETRGGDRAEGLTLLKPTAGEVLVVYDAPTSPRLQKTRAVLADQYLLSATPSKPE